MEATPKFNNIRIFFFSEYKKAKVANYWCERFNLDAAKVTDVYKRFSDDDKDFLRYAMTNNLPAFGDDNYAAYIADAEAKASAMVTAKAAKEAAKKPQILYLEPATPSQSDSDDEPEPRTFSFSSYCLILFCMRARGFKLSI